MLDNLALFLSNESKTHSVESNYRHKTADHDRYSSIRCLKELEWTDGLLYILIYKHGESESLLFYSLGFKHD